MGGNMTGVFFGDDFVGEDPRVATWGVRFCRDVGITSEEAKAFVCYTVVTVLMEADSPCYIGLTVHKYWVNHARGIGWTQRLSKSSLSEEQRAFLKGG